MSSDNLSEKAALLFEECVEISDPEKRANFLATACGDSAELRREVEALLRAHQASGSFLGGGTPREVKHGDQQTGTELAELVPGSRIGPYRLIGLIGEGSTSVVFLAEQEEPIRRWVAIKIIKPGMDTRNVIVRFGLERQALALLDHPCISRLLDAGSTSSGRPFFVMELVSGVRITSYCDEHHLTIRQRLDLLIEVCNGVFHAHQRGIIHRDLKPDNILVSNIDGKAVLKIIDFGIAKVLHSWDAGNPTHTGAMPFLGTPAYMSPEQAQMMSPDVDTRTDVYSLGALLYELLTGHPPFDHQDLLGAGLEEMCRIIRTVEPLAPSERLAQVPECEKDPIAEARGTTPLELRRMLGGELDWITLKALEKLRERRYATAMGLAEDVTRHFEHQPVQAAAPSRRYRLAKLVQRNRKLAVATGVVGTLVLASAVLSIFMGLHARVSANHARHSEQAASRAERQSHRALLDMHVASGLAAAEDPRSDQSMLWFANAARIAGENHSQSEVNARRAIFWMNRASMPVIAFKLQATLRLLEFSNDSRYALALGNDQSWHLWDTRTADRVPWTMDIPAIQSAAWSPKGSRLALVIPTGEVRVYEAAGGMLLHAFRVSPSPATIGFSPDARYLVAGNSALHILDLDEGTLSERFPMSSQHVVGLTFSGRPGQAIVVTADDRAQVFELADGSDHPPDPLHVYPHQHVIRTGECSSKNNYREDFLEDARLSLPALVEDGTRLLTRTGPYEITFWDLASGTPVHTVEDTCCSCRFITHPETGLLACGLSGGKVGLWDIATAKPYQVLPSRGTCILDVAFGMNGKRLITAEANGMARLWAVESGKELQSPLHHCTDVDRVAFTRDGRFVATGQSDGLVRVWNVVDLDTEDHKLTDDDLPKVVCMDQRGKYFIFTREPSWDTCIREVTVYSAGSDKPVGETVLMEAGVEAVAFSPNSSMLAVGTTPLLSGVPGRLEFLDLAGMRRTGRSIDLPSPPASVAWSPVGEAVAVLCRSGELFIAQPGRESAMQWSTPVVSPRNRVNPMAAYTDDGRILVSLGPDGNIHIREATNGALLYPPLESSPHGFWSFALSPNGHDMATTSISGDVTIWNLERGVRKGSVLRHPGWVYRCRFAPDPNTLVTAAHDGKVRLWDLTTGSLLTEPFVHPHEVYDAAFTPDNRWVLTACRDGNIRIWEPNRGQIVAPPIKVGHQAFNIEFSSDEHYAVIGSLGEDRFTIPLGVLHEDLPYDLQDLCLLGEVVSGCTLEQGAIHDLTTSEWMERYLKTQRLHGDAFQICRLYGLEKQPLVKPSFQTARMFSDVTGSVRFPPASADRSAATVTDAASLDGDPCTGECASASLCLERCGLSPATNLATPPARPTTDRTPSS